MTRARDIGAPPPPSGRQLRTDISRPPHHRIRQHQADTNNRRGWGHFKASKWGQCKPSFSYEHPDYTITILKASYSKADDGTVALRPPFDVVTRVDPSVRLPSVDRLGLSSLARDDDVLAMLTSREAPEGEVGHQSYIWLARLSARAGLDFHVVAGADGRSLKLPCKAEGVDFVSPSRLLVVCDEDRSPSTFAGSRGNRFTRRPNQGVFMMVDVSGLR